MTGALTLAAVGVELVMKPELVCSVAETFTSAVKSIVSKRIVINIGGSLRGFKIIAQPFNAEDAQEKIMLAVLLGHLSVNRSGYARFTICHMCNCRICNRLHAHSTPERQPVAHLPIT